MSKLTSLKGKLRLIRKRKLTQALLKTTLCAALLTSLAPNGAYAATQEERSDKGEATEVSNSYLFNEGYYLNQKANWQDPPFTLSSFQTFGGHVVKTGLNSDTYNEETDIYHQCAIWPSLVGSKEHFTGWAFITDSTAEGATGAWVSMTYRNVGTLQSAADEDVAVPVDIKVTYTITGPVTGDHHYANYDGHPAIHFTDNFSYGTFQFGIRELDTTYEFFDSNTGAKINMDALYITHTSADKGEGMAIKKDRVATYDGKPGIFLSNNAPSLKDSPLVSESSRWSAIPGTLMYNMDEGGDSYSYCGVPLVLNTKNQTQSPPDYVDQIGDKTYYWRAICYLADMRNSNSITVMRNSYGYQSWQSSWDGYDTTGYDNGGSMYFTTNFLPLTNPAPASPEKSIDRESGVGIGDTVTYSVSQKVINMGRDGMTKYSSFSYSDPLPQYLTYKEGSAKLIDPTGTDVTSQAGSASYDKSSNTVTFTLSEDFLENGMIYEGGKYTFVIEAEVTEQPENDVDLVTNKATVTINGKAQTTDEAAYEPVYPKLIVEKHADTTNALATAIADFEYLSHDQHADKFSLVHYKGQVTNSVDKTRAYKVQVTDTLPKGLTLVSGSVKAYRGDDEGATSGIEVAEDIAQNKLTVTIDKLDPVSKGDVVNFEYDAYTTDEGNGLEVVNAVHATSPTVKPEDPGSTERHATDDGEIYVNDPVIKIDKTVSESAVQNEDYQEQGDQQREEYRVGDEITYTVTVSNTAPGTFAHNLVVTDDQMPSGFELVDGFHVSGLDENGQHKHVFYPMAGTNDTVHAEGETRTIDWSIRKVENSAAQTWGFELNVNYLAYEYPVTVTWTVRPTEEVNGWEVYNQAKATAENQPGDTFSSQTPIVWINTPHFDVDKNVRKTDGSYQVGDVASYDVELKGLKTPGTLARKTTLEDSFETEGATIVENSFVITDKREAADDIRGQVDLNRHVGDQFWHIDMTQAYGDENGYWVCDEDERPVFKDGVLSMVEGERNPVKADAHNYMKVHYEATLNDMALQNELIHNVARADSLEGYPMEDAQDVTVIGAQLSITKDSIDDGAFEAGDVARYVVTVENKATGTVANDVQIKDGFSTAKAGAAEIVDGSVTLVDAQQRPIEGWTIEWTDNEAKGHIGFAIDTNYDLESSGRIVLSYDVKYLTNNGSESIVNVAESWAENAPSVEDDYETWPADAEQSDLIIDKGSDRQSYVPGETATYTLHVTNENAEAPARNVTIHDEITDDPELIASIVKGSVRIVNEKGEAVAARITYLQAGSDGRIYGFDAETAEELSSDECLDVTYEIVFSDSVDHEASVENTAWTAADNTGRADDDNEVLITADGPSEPDPSPDPDDDPGAGPTPDPDADEEDPAPSDETLPSSKGKGASSPYAKTGDWIIENGWLIALLGAGAVACAVFGIRMWRKK